MIARICLLVARCTVSLFPVLLAAIPLSAALQQDPATTDEPSYVAGDINELVLQQWRNDDKAKTDDMCVGDRLLQWDGTPLKDNDDLVRRWLQKKPGEVSEILVERKSTGADGTEETAQLLIPYTHEGARDLFADCMVGGRTEFRTAEAIHPEWETTESALRQIAVEALEDRADDVLTALDAAFVRQLNTIRDHYRSDHATYVLTRPFQAETWARHHLEAVINAPDANAAAAAIWRLAEPRSRPLPEIPPAEALPADADFAQCVAALETRLQEIDTAFDGLFDDLSADEHAQLQTWMQDFQPVWRGQPEWDSFLAGMQLTKKLPPEKLARAIALSSALLRDITPGGPIFEALKTTAPTATPGRAGTMTTVFGADADQATIKTAIAIDLGGDDAFVFPAAPEFGQSRVLIDLGGDDTLIDRGGGIASGTASAALVIDAAGNDVYLSENRSLGFGLAGIGVLWDVEGHDAYRSEVFSQGVGCLGIGLLADQAGNDRYDASSYSQAVGLTAGCGMILDRDGDDIYACTGKEPSPYGDAGEYSGWCQGCGFGFRSAGSGGVGALVDLAGRDFYRAGQFGLGCGYFFGIGLVYDRAGDDVYECSRYGLASAAHYAAGMVLDDAGRDSYLALRSASVATLGSTWDLGLGVLVDSAGDDVYQAEVYTLGGTAQTAYGFLWDKQGRDLYRTSGGTQIEGAGYTGGATYGGGRLARNLAIFLDEGAADDEYRMPQRSNNASGVDGEFGVWVDR